MELVSSTAFGSKLREFGARQVGITLAGLALLLVWGLWWSSSLRVDRLRAAQRTWVPSQSKLGVDFLNNYHAARHWLAGGNPYTEPIGDPLGRPFVYAPLLLWTFSWCQLVSEQSAVRIWVGLLALMAAIGVGVSWKARRALAASALPLSWMIAAIVCSTPIAFAMERGNCDLLVLMLIVVATWALHQQTLARDILFGISIAVATWLKIYPGALMLGALVARRPRAFLCTGLAYVAIGLVDLPGTLQHIESMGTYATAYDIGVHRAAHPLSTYWKHLWTGARLPLLARIPGTLGAGLVLLPSVLWVSYHVFRCQRRAALLYPYLCWLTALATFLPPVSNDYNLFFLPVAALVVWDRRDPVFIHLMMALLLLWWQPVQFEISPTVMFLFKLIGLAAVGISIVGRAREQTCAALEGMRARPPTLLAA